MCTVTYIPREDGSFILTHNRDESVRRQMATPPIRRLIGGVEVIYPVDPQGKGTWIGASETGRAASLLNGGDTEHHHNPPYRHSRGLIITNYFRYPGFLEFFNDFDFEGLEPFTLIVIEEGKIYETVLDRDGLRFRMPDPSRARLYASSTLYPEEGRTLKARQFAEWGHASKRPGAADVIQFHQGQLYENGAYHKSLPEGVILKTVSITMVATGGKEIRVDYHDLLNDLNFGNSMRMRKDFLKAS